MSSNNESFDQSLMDLSLRNFWFIAHYPHSDPGSEFEIVSKRDLLTDSWDVLEKGAEVTIKYGRAKVQGLIVTISDDYNQLLNNFNSIVSEYEKECDKEKSSRRNNWAIPKRRRDDSFRQIIKVTDKETQTVPLETEDPEIAKVAYLKLKRQYEKLQGEYNRMHTIVSGVKSGLLETVSSLDNITNEPLRACNENLEKWNDFGNRRVLNQNSGKENRDFDKMIQIGSGGTKVPRSVYNSIKWQSYSAATRKLLVALFPRDILATQSLTGKPSPAFISTNKQGKTRLDPKIISDIIEIVTKKSMVSESLVRSSITTKCADENKMYKRKLAEKNEASSSAAIGESDNDKENSNANKRVKVETQIG